MASYRSDVAPMTGTVDTSGTGGDQDVKSVTPEFDREVVLANDPARTPNADESLLTAFEETTRANPQAASSVANPPKPRSGPITVGGEGFVADGTGPSRDPDAEPRFASSEEDEDGEPDINPDSRQVLTAGRVRPEAEADEEDAEAEESEEDQAPPLTATKTEPVVDQTPGETEAQDFDIPQNSVSDLEKWVEEVDDPEVQRARAQAALDLETSEAGKGRKTAKEYLNSKLETDEDSEEDSDEAEQSDAEQSDGEQSDGGDEEQEQEQSDEAAPEGEPALEDDEDDEASEGDS